MKTEEALNKFQNEFIQNSCYRLDESYRMVSIALEKLSEEQVWEQPNNALNSIGNMIVHCCGNLTQYGYASLHDLKDERDRDSEFSIKGGMNKAELLERLSGTIEKVKNALKRISIDRYLRITQVQGFELSGIGNVIHTVEHLSYHTGQIAFLVKLFINKPLGYYDGLDLNQKNN